MSGVNPGGYREASARSLRDDPDVRTSVGSATRTFDAHRVRAFAEIDADRWRDWARDVKTHTLTHLDRYLEQAVRRLEANGARGLACGRRLVRRMQLQCALPLFVGGAARQ